ncbi:MAG: ABC transporter ATP-binding protein, partial [Candidatus Kapabacteria bacterium]|nr:ABC transporter ATP-binding protein [Candidatus Kapabacteria bacterium]
YILLFTIGSGFFMFLTRKTIIVASRKIEYDVRKDFLHSIEQQSASFFTRRSTGALMAHATNDIAAVREFIGPAVMYSANTITTFCFAMTLMLRLNPTLTLYTILPLPLIALLTFRIGKKVNIAYKNVQQQYEMLTTVAQESFSGVRVIRGYAREESEATAFAASGEEYVSRNMVLARIQSMSMPAMMVLVGCTQIIILILGGFFVMHGNATVGTIAQFFMYINQLIFPIAAIGWVTNIVQRGAASTARLMNIFDEKPDIPMDADGVAFTNGDIEFAHVGFTYPYTQIPVLQDISLTIPAKSSLGVVGAIGTGKSTLVRLLSRLYDIDNGQLQIGGTDIAAMNVADLRTHIAVVPQEPFLFSMSIADNIRFANPELTDEDVAYYARIAELHNEVISFPNGYDTIIGERGVTLSGGQKLRLAIARALASNPEILILDDAFSALDTKTEHTLIDSILKREEQCTTIVIAHRLSSIQHCDTIIVIDGGRISERGTHNELISAKGYYAKMYEKQQLESDIDDMPDTTTTETTFSNTLQQQK